MGESRQTDANIGQLNAERLKRIDEEKEFNMCGISGKLLSIELSNEDYSFLYAEAERAQELEKEACQWQIIAKTHQKLQKKAEDANEPYRHNNKRLREALKEIKSMTINPREYQPSYYTLNHTARQALEGEECLK